MVPADDGDQQVVDEGEQQWVEDQPRLPEERGGVLAPQAGPAPAEAFRGVGTVINLAGLGYVVLVPLVDPDVAPLPADA